MLNSILKFKYYVLVSWIPCLLTLPLFSPPPLNNLTKFQYTIFSFANEPSLPNHISSTLISLTFALQARVRSHRPRFGSASATAPPTLSSSLYPAVSTVCNPACLCVPKKELRLEQHVSRECQLDAPQNFGGSHFLRGNTRGQEVGKARGAWEREESRGKAGTSKTLKCEQFVARQDEFRLNKAGWQAGSQTVN